uniref:Uncharacterized protein n=1 Tax=Arundo donax TaxID=35708 RepID=A0A0A8Z0B7_ARUDO
MHEPMTRHSVSFLEEKWPQFGLYFWTRSNRTL